MKNPRLAILCSQILSLRVDEEYRAALLSSFDIYWRQIIAVPPREPAGPWDDLDTLQQLTRRDLAKRPA
jgi:hypothetical protein